MRPLDRIKEYRRFGSKLGLERMNALLERLGNPQNDLKVIHVAGTNGKGSVSQYLYCILLASGYKAGLYQSPFIDVFNERIQYDDRYITDKELDEYASVTLKAAEDMENYGYEPPTEFEIITAMAFVYFKAVNCDIAVLEVGLGGRGDSTNVVKAPLCSVITSISLDHCDRLGSTIAEIAFEKAGIVKKGCPVICGAANPDAKSVIKKRACEEDSRFFDATELKPYNISCDIDGSSFSIDIMREKIKDVKISMAGKYQIQNAVTALFTAKLLSDEDKINCNVDMMKNGIGKSVLPGRMEIIGKDPLIILDGAHNPDAAEKLAESVNLYLKGKKILMVIGILADKDVDKILDGFCSITKDFFVTEPNNPRRMAASDLAVMLSERDCRVRTFSDCREAASEAVNANGLDVILFAGSLYLISDIRRKLLK